MPDNRLLLVLYCCTYSKDLKRVERLLQSIRQHNKENLKVFISTPAKDLDVFKEKLSDYDFTLINEEDIIRKNQRIDINFFYQKPGGIQQQIIKSEFWRLDISENYLVMDSDCVFIKDFGLADFITTDNIPYSIIHEGRDFLQATQRFGPKYARRDFLKDRIPIRDTMGRKGVVYDYGYAPFLWSRKVWEALDVNYLQPNQMSFLDAVLKCESEFTWYGESLVKYQPIPIYPREQFFKHYHYEHQYWQDKKLGYTEEILKKDYLGVVYQSNWQTWEDFGVPQKKFISRMLRATKRVIKFIQFKIRTF
ncbi:MAG: DUF6492 family protein [Nitrosomonadales bacterium]